MISHSDVLHARQMEVLNEVARIASLDLELQPMMQRITDALANKFEWEFVALAMVDLEQKAFVCEAMTTTLATEIDVGYSRELGTGVVGEVAATEEPILLDDVHTYPNYIETTPGIASELCVPVRHAGQLVAILNLESTRPAAFRDQLPLLLTVADQIAGAVANARLYAELKLRARLMEMMSEVSRTALEATDLDELLDRVAIYVRERFPVEIVSIALHDAGEYVQKAQAGDQIVLNGARHSVALGIVGRCIRIGATQLVLDVGHDPDYISVNPQTKSELAVPIVHHNEILGVLNLESRSADFFTPANVLAFEAFADQVAGAIHLATMKDLLDKRTRDLQTANEHLSHAIETLHRISTIDPLTGAANRRQFDDALGLEWRRAARSGAAVSLLMIDIDSFKAYNDTYGHQAGDECLRRVSAALRVRFHRAGDLVARYGGEEFAVLIAGVDIDRARELAEMLRTAIEDLDIEHAQSATGDRITISIGVASLPSTLQNTVDDLIRTADEALYTAKREGRNRVVVQD